MQRKRKYPKRLLKAPLEVYQKRLEMIEELLEQLQELIIQDSIIVVEGKRDVAALNALGLTGDFRLATHHSLMNFCEELAGTGQNIVILTDWDRRGNILASKIVEILQSLGTSPETRIRELVVSLVQKEIKDVESLPGYVGKLKEITRATDGTDPF
ncbi:toprim domain-containing protein [Methanolobus sp. WCC4]|uniref:toprim domain-containing protein n=1 Tax=Methanolobus sp. WCC4 TaxID=3125784 RepID=UPI0030F96A25